MQWCTAPRQSFATPPHAEAEARNLRSTSMMGGGGAVGHHVADIFLVLDHRHEQAAVRVAHHEGFVPFAFRASDDAFQRRFIVAIYDNPVGTRRALLSLARKNGKTALIAGLVLVALGVAGAGLIYGLGLTLEAFDSYATAFLRGLVRWAQ